MQVILLERVAKLGQMGDVVNVKPGFARNFLLPRGKALRATEANKSKFEAQRATIEADNAKRREAAEAQAKTMTDVSVVLIRQASNAGALYGSVTPRDAAEAANRSKDKYLAAASHDLLQPLNAARLFGVRLIDNMPLSAGGPA